MKTCAKCGLTKTVDDFALASRSRDGRQHHCRTCNNASGMRNYHEHKERYFRLAKERDQRLDELINAAKDRPCADCGVRYQPFVMDFDHLDAQTKIANIATMRRRRMSFDTIRAEIEKCEVVCANCHRGRSNSRQPARYPH